MGGWNSGEDWGSEGGLWAQRRKLGYQRGSQGRTEGIRGKDWGLREEGWGLRGEDWLLLRQHSFFTTSFHTDIIALSFKDSHILHSLSALLSPSELTFEAQGLIKDVVCP